MNDLVAALERLLDSASDKDLEILHTAAMKYVVSFNRSYRALRRAPLLSSIFDAIFDEYNYRNAPRGL